MIGMTSRFTALGTIALVLATPASAFQSELREGMRAYQAQIAAAEKSLRLNETRELHRWLDSTDPELRGWEWDFLRGIADTSAQTIESPNTPTRIAISPTGDLAATVEGSLVRLWSLPGFEPLRTIEGHGDAIYRAEFSPNGDRLVTVSRDVTSRTWNTATGDEIARIDLANPAFAAACWSPDGRSAATCAWERDESGQVFGLVWVWDAATGEVHHTKRVGVKPLSSIRYTPDGSTIAVGSWDGIVHLLDPSGKERARCVLPDDGVYNAVNDIAIDPAGRVVAAASKDGSIAIFNLSTAELVGTLRGHGGFVESVAFSPEGETLASASVDTSVRLWDVADWSEAGILRGSRETARSVVWLDERSVAACALDRHVRVWSVDAADAGHLVVSAGTDGTYSATPSPAGDLVAVACFDGRVRLISPEDGRLLHDWDAHGDSSCHTASFSADGARMATGSWDRTARVWDMDERTLIATLEAGEGVYCVAMSPDGGRVALAGDSLQIWDVKRRERIHAISIKNTGPTRIEFDRTGRRVVSGWTDGIARVHDAESGALLGEFGSPGPRVEAAVFSGDGAALWSGDTAGVVRKFDAASGAELSATDTGAMGISHLSAHGERVVAATDRLWFIDARTGEAVLGYQPVVGNYWHAAWLPDGSGVSACTTGGAIVVLTR